MVDAFRFSQKQLSLAKTITLPRREDHLQIITDASQSQCGIAATLYVIRNDTPLIAGFFNAKLRPHQVNWLPCEEEALCIGAAVSHFAPEIINSDHTTVVLTDSMPCIQAYRKLCRGEFSSSARVATFLSVISRYQEELNHIKGSENTFSDYASRNPLECSTKDCQVCRFVKDIAESVVRSCTVQDVLDCKIPVPFSTRAGWHEMQQSCKSLRRKRV